MTSFITHDSTTLYPVLVLGFESTREGANIVHPILGSANPDVTFRPAALRTGTLSLLFSDEEDSKEAEDLHATGTVFNLSDTDRDTVEMNYVVAGDITRRLEQTTRNHWVLDVDFQEVTL